MSNASRERHANIYRILVRNYGNDFDTEIIAARILKAADRHTFGEAAIIAAARALCPATGPDDGDWVCPAHYADVKATAEALQKAQP